MISLLFDLLKSTLFIAVVFVRLVLPDILHRANYAIIEFIYRTIRVTSPLRSDTCCYPSRRSRCIWLSDEPRGLWCRLLRQLSGLLPLAPYGAYRDHIVIDCQIILLALNRRVALMLFQPRPNYLAHRTYHHLQNM